MNRVAVYKALVMLQLWHFSYMSKNNDREMDRQTELLYTIYSTMHHSRIRGGWGKRLVGVRGKRVKYG